MKHHNYIYALFLIFVSVFCFGLHSDAHAAKTKTTAAYTSVKLPKQKGIKKKLRIAVFRFYKAFGEADTDTTPWDVTSSGSDIHRSTTGLRNRYPSILANAPPFQFIYSLSNSVLVQQQSAAQYSFVSVTYKLIFPKHWFW